jgi:hypothetical protein
MVLVLLHFVQLLVSLPSILTLMQLVQLFLAPQGALVFVSALHSFFGVQVFRLFVWFFRQFLRSVVLERQVDFLQLVFQLLEQEYLLLFLVGESLLAKRLPLTLALKPTHFQPRAPQAQFGQCY